MKIDGFTYVRNGIRMGYPFIESIKSALPIVDRMIVVVGDSDDGTRDAVENLANSKIVIIDSIWSDEKRKNGEIFKDQSNLGLQEVTADWALHIQADEVLHENEKDKLLKWIEIADKNSEVDGLLFPFLHFWGDYNHIRNTRRTHAKEIRAFKNNRNIESYKDSQGFRIFDNQNIEGKKLKVLLTDISFYHYSYTRNPKLMKRKSNYFHRFWHGNDWLKKNTDSSDFDFNEVDKLEVFNGQHPKYMNDVIAAKDWDFVYNPSKSNMTLKDKVLGIIEKIFNYRLFEYRNYIIIKSLK